MQKDHNQVLFPGKKGSSNHGNNEYKKTCRVSKATQWTKSLYNEMKRNENNWSLYPTRERSRRLCLLTETI